VRSQNFIPFHSDWPDPEGLHKAGAGVGEEIDGKGELVAELLVEATSSALMPMMLMPAAQNQIW